jgi:hypothetical protein
MFRACQIQREGFAVQTKLEPLILAHITHLKIIKRKLELRKLQPPKVEGVKYAKKKTLNAIKPIIGHPKNSLYVVLSLIRVQK